MLNRKLAFLNDHTDEMLYEVNCPFCNTRSSVVISSYDWMIYKEGEKLIQDCFPTLTPSERELFISGMCVSCQDKIFGGDDE